MKQIFMLGNTVKAALNMYILTAGEMTICNVKGVTCSDKVTENYHPIIIALSSMEHSSVFQLILLVLRLQLCGFDSVLAALITQVCSYCTLLYRPAD